METIVTIIILGLSPLVKGATSRAFAAGGKPRAQYVEVHSPVRPGVVVKDTDTGLYEFVNDFGAEIAQQVSTLCAAGEFPASSGPGRNELLG
jgi:hypothetical protein